MPMNEPTLGEVARTLVRIETDIGRRLDDIVGRLDRFVAVEVYEAHRAALGDDLDDLAAELDELHQQRRDDIERRAADRRILTGAVTAAVLSLVVSVLISVLGIK